MEDNLGTLGQRILPTCIDFDIDEIYRSWEDKPLNFTDSGIQNAHMEGPSDKPSDERPYKPSDERPYKPSDERPCKPSDERPYKPSDERPYKPSDERPYKPSDDLRRDKPEEKEKAPKRRSKNKKGRMKIAKQKQSIKESSNILDVLPPLRQAPFASDSITPPNSQVPALDGKEDDTFPVRSVKKGTNGIAWTLGCDLATETRPQSPLSIHSGEYRKKSPDDIRKVIERKARAAEFNKFLQNMRRDTKRVEKINHVNKVKEHAEELANDKAENARQNLKRKMEKARYNLSRMRMQDYMFQNAIVETGRDAAGEEVARSHREGPAATIAARKHWLSKEHKILQNVAQKRKEEERFELALKKIKEERKQNPMETSLEIQMEQMRMRQELVDIAEQGMRDFEQREAEKIAKTKNPFKKLYRIIQRCLRKRRARRHVVM